MASYNFLENYAKGGLGQLDQIQNHITELLGGNNTPGDNQNIYNQLSAGYQNSPDTQFRMNQLTNYNRNAHATQGTAGGGYNRFDDLNGLNQIMAQGEQKYFNDRFDLYKSGLGLSQNVMNNGQNAANSILSGQLSEEQLAEQKRQFDAQQADKNPSWLSAGVTALGNYVLPGIGGMIGNAAGNYTSNLLGKVGGNTSSPGLNDLLKLKNSGFFK